MAFGGRFRSFLDGMNGVLWVWPDVSVVQLNLVWHLCRKGSDFFSRGRTGSDAAVFGPLMMSSVGVIP